MIDKITILRARGGRLAKYIRADGSVVGYDQAKTFDFSERQVADLAELHAVLRDLAGLADCAIVRAAIADPSRTRRERRLLHQDGDDLPTLLDVPRQWVALDFDGLTLPPNHPADDVFSCAVAAILTLPAAFRGCAAIAQATASHGRKPGGHLRLWYWLDRPATSAELAFWLRGVPHLDRASFSAAQVIYVANPVFEPPQVDPLPRRLVLLGGPETVRVPPAETLRPPPPPAPKSPPDLGNSRSARYAAAALQAASIRIRSAPVGGRHAAILRESRGLGRLVAAGTLPESAAVSAIASAARAAGKVDQNEISAALHWGFAHASPAAWNHVDVR